MIDWNEKAKRYLKSELVLRGITHARLAELINETGGNETKASIDGKISRGSFSAAFLFQSLSAIGCTKIELEDRQERLPLAAEPKNHYES